MCCSINNYIIKNKINRASELFMKTYMSVEPIARDLGFSSANYMGLVFNNKLACSLLQFKKKNEIREAVDRASIKKIHTKNRRRKKIKWTKKYIQ